MTNRLNIFIFLIFLMATRDIKPIEFIDAEFELNSLFGLYTIPGCSEFPCMSCGAAITYKNKSWPMDSLKFDQNSYKTPLILVGFDINSSHYKECQQVLHTMLEKDSNIWPEDIKTLLQNYKTVEGMENKLPVNSQGKKIAYSAHIIDNTTNVICFSKKYLAENFKSRSLKKINKFLYSDKQIKQIGIISTFLPNKATIDAPYYESLQQIVVLFKLYLEKEKIVDIKKSLHEDNIDAEEKIYFDKNDNPFIVCQTTISVGPLMIAECLYNLIINTSH